MENQTNQTEQQDTIRPPRDLYQEVTDTIVSQLEAGVVPWQKPWQGQDSSVLSLPQNTVTGNHYRGINILLLWTAALQHEFPTQEWASFYQWQNRKQSIRKGEKGTTIVYYDTIEKEENGELKKIPLLKSSVVFNKSQLANYKPEDEQPANPVSLVERIGKVEEFIYNTEVIVEHKGTKACYLPGKDKIQMPAPEYFIDTETSKASEGYYATLLHELTHWTGHPKRLDRKFGKKFGDETYAMEELVADLGSAFLCAELDITKAVNPNHASYIDHWLKQLKDNKYCVFKAASEATNAIRYMKRLEVK